MVKNSNMKYKKETIFYQFIIELIFFWIKQDALNL